MPEVREVFADGGASGSVVLATRYGGHYFTRDNGASWFNVCHDALGSDDTETYGATFSRSGAFVAATGFRGVASSVDGCSWVDWSPLDLNFITDVTVISAGEDEGDVLALDRREPPRFWSRSVDVGAFVPYGSALPANIQVSSIEVSRDGRHVYVTAEGGAGGLLVHSADAAESWETLAIPGSAGMTAELVGSAAGNPEVVVVNLGSEAAGRILLTRNAGQSWETVYEARHAIPAAAVDADGTLFFGGPDDGLHRGSVVDVGAGFARIADLGPASLTPSEGRLFAVKSQLDDGYSVALSTDGGHTFTPFFDLCRANVVAACNAETTVGLACSTGIENMPWQPMGNVCQTEPGNPDAPPAPPADDVPAADPALGAPASASCSFAPPSRRPGEDAPPLLAIALALATTLRIQRKPRPGLSPA
jgi:hypothetical protein